MIKFEHIREGFDIYFKDYKFFSHTSKNPCFEIGIGTGKYKQNHAMFRINEKVPEKLKYKNFKLLSETHNQVIVDFEYDDISLVVEFFIKEEKLLISFKCENSLINRLWIKIVADKNEAIFGCGEQFSELNLRGKKVPIWVEDASPASRMDHTYYPQPNFISTNNYFCHVETGYYSEFDFKNEDFHELYIWNVPDEIYLGKYNLLIYVVKKLNKFLGLQPRLPEWIFDGIWLGIQGGPEIVNKKIEKALSNGIKVTAVWCQDWQGIRYTSFGKQLFWDWKYDEKIYPNLPQYIKELNNQGIKFLGYINTMLALEGDLYKEASEKGYCIKNQEGEDYQVMMTDFPAAQIDFSNPNAIEWIKSIIKKNMIGIGLGGWMVDYGEYVPIDAAFFSGISGEEFHNLSPTLWTKVNYDAIKEENLLGDVIFFARSGFIGASKYAIMQFSGDQRVDWDERLGLPSVIPGAINIGLCGIGYYHFDIGCYTTFGKFKREKELFMRSAEMATFSMLMRTHEGNRPDENWQFDSDEETLTHLSRMVRIHVQLKPYLKFLSETYQQEGIPPIRGCSVHYEKDQEVRKVKYQYLLGEDLLIAPVIKPKIDQWKIYLPRDNWVHIWSGECYSGGWVTVDAPIGQPPAFYRKESEFSELFKSIKDL
ncbi:MAG: alpha-glucosidase [Candidatus Heimdallarchaeota archaeon]